ncbi:uncharacterized protein EHS24_004803 [Apiotrichum porosum]|uniref:Cytochrome c oxidase assembly protein COX20, mitochondrial n=1 Tax=Apiotrichum porosum TaxID=105984 RepID=A0A427Y641_9TREE|nr:uncharacterized protein EHS24_004803 [Apiotrichum porosum]RSH86536.1 hypothetical protein EHS24_004803 [Apiotrichum porosum]
MADKRPLNIPAGNSPVSPEPEDMLPNERRTDNRVEDYTKAIKQLHPRDFTNWTSWPCVREALMLGIGGGAAAGAVRFLGTGRVNAGANVAVLAFVGIACGSHALCVDRISKEREKMRMIQERFPHRHVSNLKKQGADWVPPPSSTGSDSKE